MPRAERAIRSVLCALFSPHNHVHRNQIGTRILYWVRGNYRVKDNLGLSVALWLSTKLQLPLQVSEAIEYYFRLGSCHAGCRPEAIRKAVRGEGRYACRVDVTDQRSARKCVASAYTSNLAPTKLVLLLIISAVPSFVLFRKRLHFVLL